MKTEQTECSEKSVYKIQTPEDYPEENIQHTEHGKSLKSVRKRVFRSVCGTVTSNQALPSSGLQSLEGWRLRLRSSRMWHSARW